jgi:hypothetical protein
MELVYAVIIGLSILNIFPWIFLLIRRPDDEIFEKISESDEALAKIAHYLIQKMDSMAEMAGDLRNPGEFDLGSLISSMIQRNMGLNNNENVYGRNERGEFDGTQEIIETTHLPPEELLESDRNG